MILREEYSSTDTGELCRLLGRSDRSIYSRARLLGLRRDSSYLSALGRKLASSPESIAKRFQKGQTPANKGKKMPAELYAKCSATMFKPGHAPINRRPVGSERVNVDGYVEVKISEPNKWALKHRMIWEAENGPVPKGYNIQFISGNRLDVRLENLYIISRAEQLKTRNSIQARYPEDLRKVIHAKATLKRQITLYNKKHNEK